MSSSNSLEFQKVNSFVDEKSAERKIEYGKKPDLITEKQSKEILKNTLSI
tara:strand:+ start:1547 stop:1696 length:150 start_codon:yes stop_codon:yes gene_type:complete